MTTADGQALLDLPGGDPPSSSSDRRASRLPWLVLSGLLIWALGYVWWLGGSDWGRSSSTDVFNAGWACAQCFLAFAGYGVARLPATTPGVTGSWRRSVFFGFTGFLLLVALAWVVVLRQEIRIEQRIGGPVFTVNTGSAAMRAIGLCAAVLGMTVTYVVTSRTPRRPRHDDGVEPHRSD